MEEETLAENKETLYEWTDDECDYHKIIYHEDDVREAIKRIIERISKEAWEDDSDIIDIITEEAGEELTK